MNKDKRALISFWITVVSFIGSILFVGNMLLNGGHRSSECKECVDRMLYLQHRVDSLEHVLREKHREP